MAIRTAEDYRASLRDGRRVYIMGEKVEDVTTHPVLGPTVDTVAGGYELCTSKDPAIRDLYVASHPVTGEPISRYYVTPRTSQDLINRSMMIRRSIELVGSLPFGRDIGTDCLNAAFVVAGQMGNQEYQGRALAFLDYLRHNDLITCGAVTDVKGDRSREPANQKHPDYYLHVVDRNADGIVVKGAKAHITSAPVVNEVVVLPTRQMRENEADYAVAFAVPANAEGVTFVARGGRGDWTDHEFHPTARVGTLTEGMIIFDNVFVPWERVFMCGEWQYSMLLAYTFATYHRFTAVAYKIPIVEVMAGCALAMADVNGLANVGHIRSKLSEVIAYVETLKALGTAAIKSPVYYGEICVPNPLITNMAKLHFAKNYHEIVKLIQDIAGGIITTAPTYLDWQNPEIHDYLDHYLGASAKYTTEERMRLIQLTHDMVASADAAHMEVTTVHAEGSMEAQRMMILVESPLKEYRDLALFVAGVTPKD